MSRAASRTNEADVVEFTYKDFTEDVSDGDDMEARLRKLQNLCDQSLITYEEYEQKKKEILEEL